MKNFFHSLKLIIDKTGVVMPVILLLLTVAVSFASVQVSRSRSDYSSPYNDFYRAEANDDIDTAAALVAEVERLAQIQLEEEQINNVQSTLAPSLTPTPVVHYGLNFEDITYDDEGRLYYSSLPGRNANSCNPDPEHLTLDTSDYTNSEVKDVYGNDGQWDDANINSFRTEFPLQPCSDNNNPAYTCEDANNWTAGYVWTGCVKDFPLLDYFVSEIATEDNAHMTSVERNAFKNQTQSGEMVDDDITVNFSNVSPGTVWAKNDDKVVQFKVPGLKTIVSNGNFYPKSMKVHAMHISPYVLDKINIDGYTLEERDDSWLAQIRLFFKNTFTKSTISDDPASSNETVLDQKQCMTYEAGPITKINDSDKRIFKYANDGGTCEQIIDAGNFELGKSDICDAALLGTSTDLGRIEGVNSCMLDIPDLYLDRHKTFESWKMGRRLDDKDIGIIVNRVIDYTTLPLTYNCEKRDICGRTFSCDETVEQLYRQCRQQGIKATNIGGTPTIKWEQNTYFPDLMVEGLDKYLVNVTEEESTFMNPEAEVIIHENVGIRINTCFSLYDLQNPTFGSNNIERSDAEWEYIGSKGDLGTGNPFDPFDVSDEYTSRAADILENTNTNNPANFVANYINIDPSMYNPAYSGGYKLAKDKENNKSTRICYVYYIPFVGQIPRMNERIAYNWNEAFDEDSGVSVVDRLALNEYGSGLQNFNWRDVLDNENYKYVGIPMVDGQDILRYPDSWQEYWTDESNPNKDILCTNGCTKDDESPLDGLLTHTELSGLGFQECIPSDGSNDGGGGGGGDDDPEPIEGLVSPVENTIVYQCYGYTVDGNHGKPGIPENNGSAKRCMDQFGETLSGMSYGGTYFHNGVDLIDKQPIYSAGDGVVVKADCGTGDTKEPDGGNNYGFGCLVVIKHEIIDNDTLYTFYAHLESISVSKGSVTVQDQVGMMGTTGNSTGVHLHFEISNKPYSSQNNSIDPSAVVLTPRSSVQGISTPSVLSASATGGSDEYDNKFDLPLCRDIDPNVWPTPSGPVPTGNVVPPTPGGIKCLIKTAVDAVNSSFGHRITEEMVYSIGLRETQWDCTDSWTDWARGARQSCGGDPNETSFITPNLSVDSIAYGGNGNGVIDGDEIDVRGVTQFESETFNNFVSANKAVMDTCTSAIGLDTSINPDPLSNSKYSRFRVGDMVCVTIIKNSEDARTINKGLYVPNDLEWDDYITWNVAKSYYGGSGWASIPVPVFGNCFGSTYCADILNIYHDVGPIFDSLDCKESIKPTDSVKSGVIQDASQYIFIDKNIVASIGMFGNLTIFLHKTFVKKKDDENI